LERYECKESINHDPDVLASKEIHVWIIVRKRSRRKEQVAQKKLGKEVEIRNRTPSMWEAKTQRGSKIFEGFCLR
jgi:hypothetical protein